MKSCTVTPIFNASITAEFIEILHSIGISEPNKAAATISCCLRQPQRSATEQPGYLTEPLWYDGLEKPQCWKGTVISDIVTASGAEYGWKIALIAVPYPETGDHADDADAEIASKLGIRACTHC